MVRNVPGTTSAYAERVIGGYYLDIVPDRDALARYGLLIGNLQDTIVMALGGETVTTTVEGRERYTVNVRYPRDFRDNPEAIAREVLVPPPGGGAVPLGEVAKVQQTRGPNAIRTENGELAVYIYVDMQGRDLGGYVADAQKAQCLLSRHPSSGRVRERPYDPFRFDTRRRLRKSLAVEARVRHSHRRLLLPPSAHEGRVQMRVHISSCSDTAPVHI